MRTKVGVIIGIAVAAFFGTASFPTLVGAATSFKDVIVRNSAAEPVPVTGLVEVANLPTVQRATDLSYEQPFHGGTDGFGGLAGVVIPDGEFSQVDSFVVPAGKRLFIRQVWVEASVAPDSSPLVLFDIFGTGDQPQHMSFAAELSTSSTRSLWNVLEEVYVTAEPGQRVRMNVNRFPNNAGDAHYRWSVNGFLVDV